MSFCEKCGKPLHEGARFCGACGAIVPEQVEKTEEPDPPQEPAAWDCASCGEENTADAVYCSHCGARHFVTAPPDGQAEEAPTAVMASGATAAGAEAAVPEDGAEAGGAASEVSRSGISRVFRTPWMLALIISLIVAAIAVAAVLVVVRRGNDESARASFETQSQAIVTSLVPTVESVSSSLPVAVRKCVWSTKLTEAVRTARELRVALTQAQSDYAELESQTDDQAATKEALGKAITSLTTYSDAVTALPGRLAVVKTSEAESVHQAGAAAQAACRQLRSVAPDLPPLTVGACAALPAGARKARADAVLRTFLVKIENNILNQSQYGRSDLVSAVSGVESMTLNPDDAAVTIESVQSNRQSLLDQMSAMTIPNDRRAAKVFTALQESLQHSIEADRYYSAWMHEVYEYYYQEPEGYMGNVPHDANYDSAVSQSDMAGSAKSRFCRVYNPLARRFGLRHDWQVDQL